jgi:ribosomal protein S18 acetylase RimI-like enzyme
MPTTLRTLDPGDDLHALTGLLHRAYAPLAAAGMNFSAASQSVDTTRERVAAGDTWVALDSTGQFVGTITLSRPRDPAVHDWARDHAWICAPDIAQLNQLAVEPAYQGTGLGRHLIDTAEEAAQLRGAARLVLDTAEPATHLRRWYERLGYRAVGIDQWPGKTYRSVIYEKPIPARLQPGPTA